MRVVSLLPSATEIVAALGFREQLVGRSHECDFPPGIEALPACTASAIEPDRETSCGIDRQVKEALANAASIYSVDTGLLEKLKPDVIVTQDQCEVCAVSLTDVEAAVCAIVGNDTKIVSLNPTNLDAVYADINRVAAALGARDAGAALVADMRAAMARISLAAKGHDKPRVACVEWADPLMAAGNWVPELVTIASGVDPFGTAGAHAPWLDPKQLFETDPDIIVFMPCGFGLQRSAAEAKALLATPDWQGLSAVKAGRVYATDGNSFFNRPGPRLVESAEILSEIFSGAPDDPKGRWHRVQP